MWPYLFLKASDMPLKNSIRASVVSGMVRLSPDDGGDFHLMPLKYDAYGYEVTGMYVLGLLLFCFCFFASWLKNKIIVLVLFAGCVHMCEKTALCYALCLKPLGSNKEKRQSLFLSLLWLLRHVHVVHTQSCTFWTSLNINARVISNS